MDKNEVLKAFDDYFTTVTPGQLYSDLKETDSLKYLADENDELLKKSYNETNAQPVTELFTAKELFLESLEFTYKMTTKEFRSKYEEDERVGNVDFQMWYWLSS